MESFIHFQTLLCTLKSKMTSRLSQIQREKATLRKAIHDAVSRLEELDQEEYDLLQVTTVVSEDFDRPLKPGDKVVIGRNDEYYRRTGTLEDRHGGYHWRIRLDPSSQASPAVINKADRSLFRLHRTTDKGGYETKSTTHPMPQPSETSSC